MPDLSGIRKEFPDYPLEAIPEGIPNWLYPVPWHNDTCPIWGDESYAKGEGGIVLAIDYPDPQDREECQTAGRFSCWRASDMGENASEPLTSDDFQEVLAELRRLNGP